MPDAASTPAPAIRQIERTSAAEAVREQLLGLIQGGALSVGDKLPSEHELARSFGVSRPIVREALGALRAAGVIESRTGSGTFVTATQPTRGGLLLLGRYALEDLHEVRAHVEVPGAGLAAQRRTADQAVRLAEIVARHRTRKSPVEWVADDLAFHGLLAEATGNDLHTQLVRDLGELQQEQNIVYASMLDLEEAPLDEHAVILNAVERRDREGAEAAMAAHLDAILERVRSVNAAGAVGASVS
ncbi:MAG: FadR family transcriptional regulator [Solirubrobacteraceae bacterium]|nr:FadR family transcriptional regulator [Solirubrobacteraceae bacterium]